MTFTIDELRHQLRDTQNELQATRTKLNNAKNESVRLRKENDDLKERMRRAVAPLLPEGTTLSSNWDNYKEPGY